MRSRVATIHFHFFFHIEASKSDQERKKVKLVNSRYATGFILIYNLTNSPR